MDAKTLAALEESIAKWKRNAQAMAPGEYLTGPDNCSLCVLFHEGCCEGCPVMARTGRDYCRFTPYNFAATLCEKWWMTGDPRDGQKARDAAREEAAFLESLLPASDALTEIKKLGDRE